MLPACFCALISLQYLMALPVSSEKIPTIPLQDENPLKTQAPSILTLTYVMFSKIS